MQRRRFKHVVSFPDDLTQEAERFRAEAEKLPPGMERHDLERKARQAETAAHIDEWLKSPGFAPPGMTRASCVASRNIWRERPNSKRWPRRLPSTC